MVLIGLTVGLLALLYALHAAGVQRAGRAGAARHRAGQGVIGYTQYFTGLPPVLVALHMFGACLVWIAALSVVLIVARPASDAGSEQLAEA